MDIFYGMGSFHPSAYLAVFIIGCVVFCSVNWSLRGAIYSFLMVVIAYISPCLFTLGFLLVSAGMVYRAQLENERIPPGKVYFTHDFFGDNHFSGWHLQNISSYTHLNKDSKWVSDILYQTALRAVAVDPYLSNGDVIVETKVEMREGIPVIIDGIVTYEQIERMREKGYWDDPQPYKGHVSRIDKHGSKLETDKIGVVNLPAPSGIEHQFMSQFNGPKIHRRIRR